MTETVAYCRPRPSELDPHAAARDLGAHAQVSVLSGISLPADRPLRRFGRLQVGYVPFDYKRLRGPGQGLEVQAVPMSPACCPICAPATPIGDISAAAAEATGIPAGLPLIATAATRRARSSAQAASIRTSGVSATARPPRQHDAPAVRRGIPLIPPYPSAVPGATASRCRSSAASGWSAVQDAVRPPRAAPRRGGAGGAEQLLEQWCRRRHLAHGLVLQPYWSPGLKEPGPGAKGPSSALATPHRAHVYRPSWRGWPTRCAREGALREAQRCRHHRAARVGRCSQSDAAMQLRPTSSGCGRAPTCTRPPSGRGHRAAVGLGLHAGFAAALAR